jgi:hypothetical protein
MTACTAVRPQISIEELSREFMNGYHEGPEKQLEAITQSFKASADAYDDNRGKLTQYIEELKTKVEDLSKGNRAIRDVFGELFREKMAQINKLEYELALMKSDKAKLLKMIFDEERKKLWRTQTLISVSINLPSGRHTITS